MEAAKKYIKQLEALEQERTPWDERNEDITRFQIPGRGKYKSTNPEAGGGEDRWDDVINESTALAARIMVAGMIWGLSSPASDWFRVGLADKDLQKSGPVKEHLTKIKKGLNSVFHRSNFYSSLYPMYEEEIGFGGAVQIALSDPQTIAHYHLVTAGLYVLANNDRGESDTLGRRYHRTAKQIVERFGEDNVSEKVKKAYSKDPYKWFDVIHFIEPNPDHDDRRLDNEHMAYTSIYLDPLGDNKVLEKTGFRTKPFFAPKFGVVGEEVYGRGIGGMMLGSSMQIQEMEKTSLDALFKTVDPPTVGPAEFSDNIDVSAGGFNPSPPGKVDQIKALYQINYNITGVEEKIRQVESRIARGYFNDLFLYLLNHPNATATEILERKSEKVILLGPVVTRQEDEYFTPAIKRTYDLMVEVDYFPPAPPELQDQTLEIEFISQLAIAQKIASTESVYAYMAFVAQAAAMDPGAIDKFDADEAIDEMAELLGVPPKINRPEDEVIPIREARSEVQAKQEQSVEIMETIEGARQMSKIDTAGKNALTDVTSGQEEVPA